MGAQHLLRRYWFILICGLIACDRSSATPGGASAAAPTSQWVFMTRAAADSAVYRERGTYKGLWTTAQVAKRLIEAGFAVSVTDSVIHYPHLSVEGRFIHLGRGDVHAFFYPDTLRAKVDAARLDSTTAAPPGVVVQWPKPLTMVRNLNLVVIFLSDSPSSSVRFSNAILGGLPPPESIK